MNLEGPDVLQIELVRRAAKEAAQLGNGMHIRTLCRRRQIADCHVLDHATTQRPHLGHRLCCIASGACHRWTVAEESQVLIRELAGLMPDKTIAALLNRAGKPTSRNNGWTQKRVCTFRNHHGIDGERLQRSELALDEAADRLNVSTMTVLRMIRRGVVPARQPCKGASWVIKVVIGTAELTRVGKMNLTHPVRWFLRDGGPDVDAGGTVGIVGFAQAWGEHPGVASWTSPLIRIASQARFLGSGGYAAPSDRPRRAGGPCSA
jgi:excisionase family DNA binding protein